MAAITAENVAYTISNLHTYSDFQLVHVIKCCSSLDSTADKKLCKPLMEAAEKQRKKLNTAKQLAENPEQPISSTADMYEGATYEP